MGNHLERVFRSWLAAGLLSGGASNRRGRERRRRRFEAVLLPLEDRQLLSTFPVTSTADSGSTGTLRWAVAGANADTSPSTIVFDLGTAAATITLTQGQLELSNTSESVTINDGAGQGPVTISGNGQSGAFLVDSGVTASISGLKITDGATQLSRRVGDGSINDLGTLTLSDCTIANNPDSTSPANGVYVNGTADITDCTITGGNSYYGAGVFVFGGTADMTGARSTTTQARGTSRAPAFATRDDHHDNCTISGNTAGGGGGGLYNSSDGQLKVYGCTISDNTSSNEGAGVYNEVTLTSAAVRSAATPTRTWAGACGTDMARRSTSAVARSAATTLRRRRTVQRWDRHHYRLHHQPELVGRTAVAAECSMVLSTNTPVLTLTDSTISGNTVLREAAVESYTTGQAFLTDSTIANNVADSRASPQRPPTAAGSMIRARRLWSPARSAATRRTTAAGASTSPARTR